MRRFVILAASVLILGGCASMKEKRDRNRAHNFFRDHPEELAELCGDKFETITKYLPGDTIIRSDTTVVTDTVEVTVDCPDGTQVKLPPARTIYIRDSVFIRDTIRVENTARVEQYRLRAEREERQRIVGEMLLDQEQKKSRNRGWMLAAIIAAIGLYTFFKIRGRSLL